ncbi:MAG TPA: CcmD family protein [Sphingobacterium sp.]|nr:CcmD family protein [Sphingobacterium sp.]
MNKLFLTLSIILFHVVSAFSQSGGVEMATGLRSSGKIWAVVLVLLTIVVGLYIYLFSIDRRIKKLEDGK